ncbi:hypothetical protein [Prescottella equi]|uniref:hypothetical protein n=1 Tax=Rhodococcus hoagii TaxID=43767 RepID=UPI000D0F02B1|nr:hypothetical protein [Prescottella equi]AVP67338.1 hypothetical protein C7H75_04860 [Prescottella equi]AVP67397.1 hypothetical protein C7H75_05180 [Prescottella equi]
MNATITPELAHRVLDALEQSGHIGPDGSLSALFIVRDAVKAWEAEAAREVEVLQLAKRLVQEEFGGYNQWHDLSTSEQERRIQYVKFILAFLAADGRLLPEGGTGAAQAWDEGFEEGFDFAGNQSLPGGIPNDPPLNPYDTPPAVPVPDSGRCTGAGDCDASPHEHGCFADTGDCDDPSDHPDSGPDGTPGKPWPTWQDVPDGVRYQGSTRYGDKSPVFVNRDGQRITEWRPGVEFANTHPDWAVERWAPFVRVDGDKA